jgi:hypothetical protein
MASLTVDGAGLNVLVIDDDVTPLTDDIKPSAWLLGRFALNGSLFGNAIASATGIAVNLWLKPISVTRSESACSILKSTGLHLQLATNDLR